jgi:hypothetical protein
VTSAEAALTHFDQDHAQRPLHRSA